MGEDPEPLLGDPLENDRRRLLRREPLIPQHGSHDGPVPVGAGGTFQRDRVLEDLCGHRARCHDRDRNGGSLRLQFHEQAFGQCLHGELTGDVGALEWPDGESPDGGRVDDAGRPPVRQHARDEGVDPVEHPVDVDLDHQIPPLGCEFPQRTGRLDTGVVEEQPDRSELGVRARRQPLDGRSIRDVRGDGENLGRPGQFACHLLQPFLRHVGQNEAHAQTGRVPGQRGTDPTSGAGDDRRLPSEQLFLCSHVHPSSRLAGLLGDPVRSGGVDPHGDRLSVGVLTRTYRTGLSPLVDGGEHLPQVAIELVHGQVLLGRSRQPFGLRHLVASGCHHARRADHWLGNVRPLVPRVEGGLLALGGIREDQHQIRSHAYQLSFQVKVGQPSHFRGDTHECPAGPRQIARIGPQAGVPFSSARSANHSATRAVIPARQGTLVGPVIDIRVAGSTGAPRKARSLVR